MGDVISADSEQDWAAIDESGSVGYSPDLIDNNGPEEVTGIWTNYDYLATNYSNIRKRGVTTGNNFGYLMDHSVSVGGSCIDFDGQGIKVSMDQADGDSGGPVYYREDYSDSGRMLISMASWGSDQVDTISCNGNDKDYYNTAVGISSSRLSDHGFEFWK